MAERRASPGIPATDAAPPASAAASASIRYHPPSERLRGAIASYYLVEVTGEGVVTDQIFPEWANFRLILSGAWTAEFPGEEIKPVPRIGVTGSLERAVWVTGAPGLLVGVGLLPQGWPMFSDAPAEAFANRMRPLADAIGPAAEVLFEDLQAAHDSPAILAALDRKLSALMRPAPDGGLIARAHAALLDPQTRKVADWAAALGLSPRQLERICLRYLGLPPKRLLRRQRLLRTLAAIREAPDEGWARSLDDQFTDQAHFIREFKYYMGESPSAYLARERPFMAEAWRRRMAVLGAPIQVLQPPTKPDA